MRTQRQVLAFAGAILMVVGACAVRAETVKPAQPGAVHRDAASSPTAIGRSPRRSRQPVACHQVAAGMADDGELNGQDFESWRDAVVEDGALDYRGRSVSGGQAGAWWLKHWDGKLELLGSAVTEDSEVWNTAACAVGHLPMWRIIGHRAMVELGAGVAA